MQSEVGQRAGRFKLLSVLGTGGFATVYRAEDTQLGTEVAIKVLHAHLAQDQGFVRRFYAEARAAARLRSHPHIVTIYDVGQTTDSRPYLVMALVEGMLLSDVLKQRHPLPFAEAIKILGQLCSALDYLHHAGLVHRDLKPSNVMIDNAGEVTLMDLGIARAVYETEGLTQTGQMVGTPSYMAPEQITGGDISPATDIYALGILAYEIMAGRTPFLGTPTSVIRDQVLTPPPPIRTFNTSLPPRAAHAIEQALAKEPEKRQPTAGAFVTELASGLPPTAPMQAPPIPAPSPMPEWMRQGPARWLVLASVMLLFLLFAGIGLLVYRQIKSGGTSGASANSGSGSPSPRPSPTPSAPPEPLFQRLLSSSVAATELPPGFSAPKVTTGSPDDDDQKNHATIQVEITLQGPDLDDFVAYTFFPTEADAKARVDLFTNDATPAGFSNPAKCFSGTGTSSGKKYGFTACTVLIGDAYIYSDSRVQGDNQTKGNMESSVALARFAVAHLQKVRSAAPAAATTTPRPSPGPSATATPRPSASPSGTPRPTAELPRSVTVTGDDPAAQLRVDETKAALAEFLARLTQDYGLVPNRPFTVHLASTEAAVKARLSGDFDFTSKQLDTFFSSKTPSQTNTLADNTVEVLVYLPIVPTAPDLRAALAFVAGSYTLRTIGGGFEKTDVYPYWFLRGFEGYQQVRLANVPSSQTRAAQDLKSNQAPALKNVAANADADTYINGHPTGSAAIDARGEAAVEYMARKYGEGVIGRLLNGNAGSVAGFNTLLQRVTGQSIDQLDSALNDSLRQ